MKFIKILIFVILHSISAILNAQTWNLGGNTNLTTTNNIIGNTSVSTTISQHPIRFFAGNQERMRLDRFGRLFISNDFTILPTQALHIYQGNLFLDGNGGNGNLFLGNGLSIAPAQWGIEYLPPSPIHPGGINFWKPWQATNGSNGNGFGNYFMFLRNDGKVGVGTECIPADAKMAINGKLYAREVEIQTNSWCDSVFYDNYSLLSFEDLRNFISAEGHLPGIPSQKEVTDKGSMAIMEMNLQLLQKVEELHLYILQLELRMKEAEALMMKNKH